MSYYANITRRQNNRTLLNPILLASGDGGDLGHPRTKVVRLGLISGRLPGCVPFVRRKDFLLRWDQLPHHQGHAVIGHPVDHLDVRSPQLQFFGAGKHLTFAPFSFDEDATTQDNGVVPQEMLLCRGQ